jgi:hypothetical protein
MKKIIRLTESDLLNIVKRVISEQEEQQETQPSDNNFIQQKYTEFTNLLTPKIKDAFIKQYPVQDAISELNSCRPSKFENFKTKLSGLKDKLKSFVSGSDLNRDIQSVSSYLEKTPNVNEQFGTVVLGGLAMLLLVSLYKSFLSSHGYVPLKSCMGPGSHLPFYLEGTFNLLNDLFHFKVQKNIFNKKIQKWDPKKMGVKGDSQRKINRDYNRTQKQKSQQQKRELSMMNRQSKQNDKNAQKNREEYYLDLIKAFDNYVITNVSNGVLTKNYLDIDNFDVIVNDFFNEENNYKYVDNPENREEIKSYFKVGV